jgi:hypothetical protein
MHNQDARNLLDRIIAENLQVHLRFESADGSLVAKVNGFIGRNALGEILIKSNLSGVNEAFALRLALDFVCDFADVPASSSGVSRPIRLRFTNDDILLILSGF